jgi:tetraacyldisaccharide 4'-kinase
MGASGCLALRCALWPLGLAYGGAMSLRNRLYDARLCAVHRLGVPVVSVGNLTVGGTGKTPAVAWLCALARAHGRRPGVLARGYGRAHGASLNDEGAMLQQRLPWLLQEQGPDRVAAGVRLVAAGADWIVLDDGFQHRRLHRDLDLVCVDAASPFGNGGVLPAGPLREFRSGLARAGLVLLTRAGALTRDALALAEQRVRAFARAGVRVYACDHAPLEFVAMPARATEPLAQVAARRCVLLSAIARPQSFRATIEALGGVVIADHRFRDHHRFTTAELDAAVRAARDADAWLVTTEKDDARLPATSVERRVLRIELRFLGEPPAPRELFL